MSGRHRRGRVAAFVGAAIALVGLAGAAAVGLGGSHPGTADRASAPAFQTERVTRMDLVEYEDVPGSLGYGAAYPVGASLTGTVTWLAPVASQVTRGQALVRVDEHPVVLLYGAVPAYRPLAEGVRGADVREFEENLHALGYDGFTVDDEFSAATTVAVQHWQATLGVPVTGTVALGDIVYAPGPLRVAAQSVRTGAPAGPELLMVTGTTRVVSIDLDIADQRYAAKGAKVQVSLPDGTTVDGVVANVGTVAVAASGDGGGSGQAAGGAGTTLPVTVAIAAQKQLGNLDGAPVSVRFVAQRRPQVLTVPVEALLALREGGYGVQLVDGSTTRVVAVTVGMFADGRVEVSGPGITEGMLVAEAP